MNRQGFSLLAGIRCAAHQRRELNACATASSSQRTGCHQRPRDSPVVGQDCAV
jgi:hypothetical protein